jgi:hypothetical protein
MRAGPVETTACALLALALVAACGNTKAGRRGRASSSPGGSGSTAVGAPAAARPADPNRPYDHAPDVIRGIYLNTYVAGSHARLHQLLDIADRTEINTFVVDVKDERGPHYDTQVPLARQIMNPRENTLRDLHVLVDTLHAHGLYAIARIVVFKDSMLSKARPDWSIRRAGGELWRDKKGMSWVSAWDRDVWDYNIALAEDAAKAGFDEIQFDYVRFPEPFPSLPPQVHPEAKGDRTDAIVAFLTEAKRRLHPLNVPVAADLFGLAPADGDDIEIGQQWERLLVAADHVLPMVYPSHFLPTHLPADPHPNRAPGLTVYEALGLGDIRMDRLRHAGVTHMARVIPWLQAFSAPWIDHNFPYGPDQAREEIDAVYRAGHDDWIFWHPGGKYELVAAAFAPQPEHHARKFQAPPLLTAYADLLEARGARVARAQVAAGQGAAHASPQPGAKAPPAGR